MISFQELTLAQLEPMLQRYIQSLRVMPESYFEEHVIKARLWSVQVDGDAAGCFAIYQDRLLSLFYLTPLYHRHSQDIFRGIIDTFSPQEAYVLTTDELMLTMCMDWSDSYQPQAYIFQDSRFNLPEAELYPAGSLSLASPSDLSDLLAATGDFFDYPQERIARGEIFLWREDGEVLGAGIIERGVLARGFASIGMITVPGHRQKGIGASIITKLKHWCYANSLTPICGCWYFNDFSRQTLLKAGMISTTRMLTFDLTKSVQWEAPHEDY